MADTEPKGEVLELHTGLVAFVAPPDDSEKRLVLVGRDDYGTRFLVSLTQLEFEKLIWVSTCEATTPPGKLPRISGDTS